VGEFEVEEQEREFGGGEERAVEDTADTDELWRVSDGRVDLRRGSYVEC
jgi:hypothetical protein